MAVFFSGGQGIRPISPNANLPITAKSTANPVAHSMGVFTVNFLLPQTFLFNHDPTGKPFVVVAGKGWLDLVLDFKTGKPNLEDIQRSYGDRLKENEPIRWKKLDRISKFLTDNVAIVVETRRQYQSGFDDGYFVLNVCVVDQIRLHRAPAVLPTRTAYAFGVSFSNAINAGFALLETYPDNAWDKWNDDTVNLFLSDASIAGTLCFQHKENLKRFAVTYGFRGVTVWSDVHFLNDTSYRETAKDICNSYHNNNKRSARIGGNSLVNASDNVTLSPQTPSPVGNLVLTASVNSHVLRNSPNQYKSEIKVRLGKVTL